MNAQGAINVPGTLTVTMLWVLMYAGVEVVSRVMVGVAPTNVIHIVAPRDLSVSYGMARQDVSVNLVTFLAETLVFPTTKGTQPMDL